MEGALSTVSNIIPNHTGMQNPPCWKKMLFLFFPAFSVKTVTFWFGLFVLIGNTAI